MNWKLQADKWLSYRWLDKELKKKLLEIEQNPKILEDCFYKNLEFGTGGIRGELGPGTNRMNIYTVRKAAMGLADYISQKGENAKQRGLVIAYDCRHKSKEFAMEVAKIVGKQGIRIYFFREMSPTPELSFAVRFLNASAGVVITASHNPPEYNGFKVYGEDGGQITTSSAEQITSYINMIQDELQISVMDEMILIDQGLLKYIGPDLDIAYLEKLTTIKLNPKVVKSTGTNLKIVFSPLHGTAQKLVSAGLKKFGFNNITIVKEQEHPDPEFTTVKLPNPEEHEAFEMAIKYGKQINADILMATDPDADRLGVAAKSESGEYAILTGNQMGALMLHYVLTQKKEKGILPKNAVVIKTIVTSEIGKAIADDFAVKTVDTLTGFKYIGEKIKEFEKSKELTFQFGYEESYGYLIGDFVRDKDAIQAAVFAAEVAAFYKAKGMTLFDGLHELYEKYGFYLETLKSLTLKGKEGTEKIADILKLFRENCPANIAGNALTGVEDYQSGEYINLVTGEKESVHLSKANVIKFYLEDGSWFAIRPSGTEPKIKFYFSVVGLSKNHSEKRLKVLENGVLGIVEKFLKE
ncbi:MAG: phospho-sugar mutase [Bacillota bacterium]